MSRPIRPLPSRGPCTVQRIHERACCFIAARRSIDPQLDFDAARWAASNRRPASDPHQFRIPKRIDAFPALAGWWGEIFKQRNYSFVRSSFVVQKCLCVSNIFRSSKVGQISRCLRIHVLFCRKNFLGNYILEYLIINCTVFYEFVVFYSNWCYLFYLSFLCSILPDNVMKFSLLMFFVFLRCPLLMS